MEPWQKRRAETPWCGDLPERGPWTLLRVDPMMPVEGRKWPIGKVELLHEDRGRVLEVTTGAGSLDAAFNAISDALEIKAKVKSLQVDYVPESEVPPKLATVTADIELMFDDSIYRGSAQTGDLLLSAVGAFLEAASRAAEDRQVQSREAIS